MKEILGLIAAALFLIGTYPYYRDIFRGITKPHLYTYIVWAIVTLLAFFGQITSGGGPGAWRTGVAGVITVGTLMLAFKYKTKDVTRFDLLCLAGAIISIIPWLLTNDPTLSVVLATVIDVLAFFPTIRKTYNDPTTETLSSWTLNFFSHGLSILALSTYAVVTYIYPAALLVMNAGMIFVIVSRRKNKKRIS